MNQVSNLSHLGSLVHTASGKDVDGAIRDAEEWAEREGKTLAGNY